MRQEVRFMLPEERSILESWRKLSPIVSDFLWVWTRWKSWETDPPVVVVINDQVAGFHAVKFTKSGYINSVFQFVLPEYRGRGFAGAMVEWFLAYGISHGATRLRMRCPKEGDGDVFWKGFGMQPFGETDKEYFYDLSLEGVETAGDLIAGAARLCANLPTDKRMLGVYKRFGVRHYA